MSYTRKEILQIGRDIVNQVFHGKNAIKIRAWVITQEIMSLNNGVVYGKTIVRTNKFMGLRREIALPYLEELKPGDHIEIDIKKIQ